MFWKCYSIDVVENKDWKSGRKRGKAVLLLSGQMDERQTDWIAGERELCKTLTGRNRWLNFKGGIENSQQRVLETAVMSSCQCQCMKYERDSCIYNFWMWQTKYSGEEEEKKAMMKRETEKASQNIFSFQGRRQRTVERDRWGVEAHPV